MDSLSPSSQQIPSVVSTITMDVSIVGEFLLNEETVLPFWNPKISCLSHLNGLVSVHRVSFRSEIGTIKIPSYRIRESQKSAVIAHGLLFFFYLLQWPCVSFLCRVKYKPRRSSNQLHQISWLSTINKIRILFFFLLNGFVSILAGEKKRKHKLFQIQCFS